MIKMSRQKKESSIEKNRFTITIGKELKEVLDKQKTKVTEGTYDVIKSSYYQAGEIIAKKIKQSNINLD
jgi:hypothetical protein